MIINVFGKKRSGKSEVGKLLSNKFNLPTIAFAKKLKDLVKDCSGLDDSYKGMKGPYSRNVDIYILNKELKKFSYETLTQHEIDSIRAIEYGDVGDVQRNLIKFIGTEIFRTRNEYHWINHFRNEISKFDKGYICDDCRFFNEYNFIKSSGEGVIAIKVVNTKENIDNVDQHASEIDIDKFPYDYMIYNNHDGISKLEKSVNDLKI
jgi:hypothetical protein